MDQMRGEPCGHLLQHGIQAIDGWRPVVHVVLSARAAGVRVTAGGGLALGVCGGLALARGISSMATKVASKPSSLQAKMLLATSLVPSD